jgi:hypothetical protein
LLFFNFFFGSFGILVILQVIERKCIILWNCKEDEKQVFRAHARDRIFPKLDHDFNLAALHVIYNSLTNQGVAKPMLFFARPGQHSSFLSKRGHACSTEH